MKAVNAGQVEAAVIYHYYYFGDQAKTGENSGNVALHYFRHQDPGAFVSLSGAGVLASSKHTAEAQALVPVEYTGFVWAALFGWLKFGEPVGLATLAGALLIVIGSWIAARGPNEFTAL